MSDTQFSGSDKSKSFWERTEGTVGMFGMVGIGIAAFIGIGLSLPFILATLQLAISTVGAALTLIPLAVALFIALKIVFDKKIHTLAWYFYKAAIWKLTNAMIETLDPIVIMKNYVANMEDKLEEMMEQITALVSQHTKLRLKIETKKREFETAMRKAKVARDNNKQGQFTLQARQAGRLKDSNVTLEQLYGKIEILLRTLRKYKEVCEIAIADTTNEVEHQEDQRDMILSASTAMARAKSVIHGDRDKLEVFNRALEIVTDQYGEKLGEIEDFMSTSETFIEGMDLDNLAFEQEALDQLEAWEAKANTLLLPEAERMDIIREANDETNLLDVDAIQKEPVRKKSRYSALLEN